MVVFEPEAPSPVRILLLLTVPSYVKSWADIVEVTDSHHDYTRPRESVNRVADAFTVFGGWPFGAGPRPGRRVPG